MCWAVFQAKMDVSFSGLSCVSLPGGAFRTAIAPIPVVCCSWCGGRIAGYVLAFLREGARAAAAKVKAQAVGRIDLGEDIGFPLKVPV